MVDQEYTSKFQQFRDVGLRVDRYGSIVFRPDTVGGKGMEKLELVIGEAELESLKNGDTFAMKVGDTEVSVRMKRDGEKTIGEKIREGQSVEDAVKD